MSMISLFSAMNGDAITDIFMCLTGESTSTAIFGRIYLFTFIVLFIYAIFNIFILIMEDAYFAWTV